MKSNANKGRRKVQFNVGDWVYVHLRPYRQLSICLQHHTKLSRCFFGPFQIVRRVGAVAYKLALPPSSKIHPVFHVSVLRKCLGNPSYQITPIDLLDQSSSLVLLPEDVLQCRTISRGGQQIHQCLTKWLGLPVSYATWEDSQTLLRKFPDQNLEGKVRLHGSGIVTNQHNTSHGPRRNTKHQRETSTQIYGPLCGPRSQENKPLPSRYRRGQMTVLHRVA